MSRPSRHRKEKLIPPNRAGFRSLQQLWGVWQGWSLPRLQDEGVRSSRSPSGAQEGSAQGRSRHSPSPHTPPSVWQCWSSLNTMQNPGQNPKPLCLSNPVWQWCSTLLPSVIPPSYLGLSPYYLDILAPIIITDPVLQGQFFFFLISFQDSVVASKLCSFLCIPDRCLLGELQHGHAERKPSTVRLRKQRAVL